MEISKPRKVMALPPLYLITDGARVGENRVVEAVKRAFRAGLSMLQVRERHLNDWQLEALVERMRTHVPAGVAIIMNRHPDLVESMDLSGTHVGGDPWQIAEAKKHLSPRRLVGYSAHSVEEVRLAHALGADYVSFSPVFRPTSKGSPIPPVGLKGLAEACRIAPIPVYALGGITPESVPSVREAGASGMAVIGAILDAEDPEDAARALLQAWEDR